MIEDTRGSCPSRVVRSILALGGALLCAGCAGRFKTHTEYLAAGFNQASLRGKTVAVVPPPADRDEFDSTVTGVSRGVRGAGARVLVVDPRAESASTVQPATETADSLPPRRSRVSYLDVLRPSTADRAASDANASYLLVVRVTGADVYRRYAPPSDSGTTGRGGAAARTSGRRVGLRLELLRLPARDVLWIASGTGELWHTRAAAPAVPGTVDDDLRAGHLLLYPQPPDPQEVSEALTRRLLAQLPAPVELQPN